MIIVSKRSSFFFQFLCSKHHFLYLRQKLTFLNFSPNFRLILQKIFFQFFSQLFYYLWIFPNILIRCIDHKLHYESFDYFFFNFSLFFSPKIKLKKWSKRENFSGENRFLSFFESNEAKIERQLCLGPGKHVMNHLTGRKQQILWLFRNWRFSNFRGGSFSICSRVWKFHSESHRDVLV